VVNFKTKNLKIPLEKIKLLLNRAFMGEIVVSDILKVPDDFHSRYSARGKVYLYWIKMPPIEPWLRDYCWFWKKQAWDIEKIRKAASVFIGVHDFSGYAVRLEKGIKTVKEIFNIEISGNNTDLKIAFHGSGFLRCMVRVLTSAIVSHGCGLVSLEELKRQLDCPGSVNLPPKAPPNGLYLVKVNYQEP
jgi:tRNA pseudouridine38-40 synthase